ncbi:hypothetical protein [Micromonospora sp. DT229]|uniref:hypothetical protein n=1 Tax=Micromonospora sp. DT229 TaxID=3393430 RepID=UPI003CF77199
MSPHLYRPDPDVPGDPLTTDAEPPCRCGRPKPNQAHDTAEQDAAQAEHLRRIGEDDR